MKFNLIEKLRKFNKRYYTLADISKISTLSINSLKVSLNRLVKGEKIIRLKRDTYILPEQVTELDKIANTIYTPSYLSFESALSRWGVLSQIPYQLSFATTKKTLNMELENTLVEYRQLKKELFFGYYLQDELFIAYSEKALLDTFYLVSLGKLKFNFNELDYSKIEKKKFCLWMRKYPAKTYKFIIHQLTEDVKKSLDLHKLI